MKKLLARWLGLESPPLRLIVAQPPPWTAEQKRDLEIFLDSTTGRTLCAHARWRHLQAASLAVQTPQAQAAQAAACGSAETLRFLHAYSGLADLPDLLPDHPERSDSEQAETFPSLHALLTHSHAD